MAGYAGNHSHVTLEREVLRAKSAEQLQIMRCMAGVAMEISPEVLDEIMVRHNAGHPAVHVLAERIPVDMVMEALTIVAGIPHAA